MNSPEIVWADEPTGNLDSENAQEVMDLLVRLNRELDATFVIITHSDAVLEMAHRTVRIRDGLIGRRWHRQSSVTGHGRTLWGAGNQHRRCPCHRLWRSDGLPPLYQTPQPNSRPNGLPQRASPARPEPPDLDGPYARHGHHLQRFTIGDSVTYGIKNIATESLRSLDELLVVDEDSELWEGRTLPEGFSEEVFAELALRLDADQDIDAALPALTEDVAVINEASRQFESGALLAGLDSSRASAFEELFDFEGAPVDLAALGPNEAYITVDGAGVLEVTTGDVLGVVLGPGSLTPITVGGVANGSYVSSQGTDVVLMMPLVLRPKAA